MSLTLVPITRDDANAYDGAAPSSPWSRSRAHLRDCRLGRDAEAQDVALALAMEPTLNRIEAADLLWVLLPKRPSFGCAFEFGWAARTGNVIVSGDWRATIFSALAEARYDDHEQAFAAIARYGR